MIGRANERAWIAELLAGAHAGRSGTLVLVGEPGVGKSVLLGHAAASAEGMLILRATGVETEVDLAFAGLDQLVRPILSLADRLPARQADALRGALGLADHASEDRFLVAAATLSLLSEGAEDRPVLCVIEDAHWLDQPSTEALAFAARRLEAEAVVVLAATRGEPWPGLPVLRLGGFGPEDAAALLRAQAGEVAPEVRDRLVAETGGNPLALAELAASLTAQQLAGRDALPHPLPLTGRVQEAFRGRVRQLPPPTRTLLLAAAADDTADPKVVFRAAGEFGVPPEALEPAERAGLLRVDGTNQIHFRHPLVRAAVYQDATFTARVAAHRALARALDGDADAERRAWHLAAAAVGPDETVARELERSAEAARQRGGYAVASTAFERAADLSTATAARARLRVAAAQAAYQAGQADRAAVLADAAGPLADGPDWPAAADVAILRARIELTRGSSTAAHLRFVAAAEEIRDREPHTAAAALIEAALGAWNSNDAGRLTSTAHALVSLRLPADDPLGPLVIAIVGCSDLLVGRIAEAVGRVRAGVEAWQHLAATGQATELDAWVAMVGVARVAGDDVGGLMLARWTVTQCRARGLAVRLPWALVKLAITEALCGHHSAAVVNGTDALRLARDLGQHLASCGAESVLAWLAAVRGEEDRCRELASDAVSLAEGYQFTGVAVFATWALGLLELSLGRPDLALDRLLDARGPQVNPLSRILVAPDMVEAAVRSGRTGELGGSVAVFEGWAACTGQPWAEASASRCRAMLAGEDDAERHFEEALRRHGGQPERPFEQARTQLLYGEWLRRARRRANARTQLAAALETFQRLGAAPWAERAGAELRATGQTVRRDPATVRLTPQELQVVQLVAEGGSNQDVAAQLFLSPRTVAYHLYKAFPKLGVRSRADLARLDLDALLTAP